MSDNDQIKLGDSQDLLLYHDGSHSYVENTTGLLILTNSASGIYLRTDDLRFQSAGGSESYATLTKDGAVSLNFDNSTKFQTTSTGVTVTGTVSDSKGDVRKIIQNSQSSAYTLVASDSGKHILASGTITIPNNVFAAGDAVTIINNTSGNLTLTASVSVLYNTADAATGNRTLATRGMATLLFGSATSAYISGAGLS